MSNLEPNPTPLILIADDDRTMRSLLNLAMEEEGYQVIEAKNGEQCLSEYTHFQPDLILLDAVMPDIDGFTCCQKIRSLPGGDRLPILMITVLDDQDSVKQAFNAGATDYITKPIHWSVLSQRVRRLLDGNRASVELTVIEEQLCQHQAWSKLISNILEQLVSGDRNHQLIEILHLIRQWSQSIRVCLYQSSTATYLESVALGYRAIEDIFTTKVNFLVKYGEQYQQEQIIAIKDISHSDLLPEELEQLKQLKTQSLVIVPIKTEERIIGLLTIHFSGSFSQDRLSTNQLLDLANLLTITVQTRHALSLTTNN